MIQDLEIKLLSEIDIPIPLYFRYVDDIVMAIPLYFIDLTLKTFNSFHPRLQFTMEFGGESTNFLDIIMINRKGTLEFNWCHEPVFSGKCLNFLFAHSLLQKKRIIMGIIDRSFLLSHPIYHQKIFELVISILI